MKILSLLVSGSVGLLLIALWIVRRRAALRARRTESQSDRVGTIGASTETIWERGEHGAVAPDVNDLGKRAFLRQLAIGSVASVAGWLATRGASAPWAEKLILEAKTGGQPLQSPSKPSAPRTPHQDDHTDEDRHNDNHSDSHQDQDDSWQHVDEEHYQDHVDEPYGDTQGYLPPGMDPPHLDWTDGHIDQGHNDHFDQHTDYTPDPHVDSTYHVDEG